jgi:hypothetical protein
MARDIKFLVKDIQDATVNAAREACVTIMNGLVEAGPGYTGEFSSAWYAVEKGQEPGGPRSSNGLYKYDLRNVPKSRFRSSGVWFEIVNGAPHAAEAMDLVPFSYEDFDEQDAVKTQKRGYRRDGATRGDVTGSGGNTSTAPADWWPTYNVGGALSRDLALGVRRGFGKARGFGK